MVKLVRNNGQFKLTVPVDLVRDKGWDAGTRFRFVEDTDGNITLKVIAQKTIDASLATPKTKKKSEEKL